MQFESQAREFVSQLPWVKDLSIKMTAQAPKPMTDEDVPPGLRKVANIIAVSSCKVRPWLLPVEVFASEGQQKPLSFWTLHSQYCILGEASLV